MTHDEERIERWLMECEPEVAASRILFVANAKNTLKESAEVVAAAIKIARSIEADCWSDT